MPLSLLLGLTLMGTLTLAIYIMAYFFVLSSFFNVPYYLFLSYKDRKEKK